MTDKSCVFCKIVSGKIPSKKIYEDGVVYAFYDIEPKAPVHVLIIPKKHVTNLSGVEKKDIQVLGKCQLVAKKLAEKLNINNSFKLITLNGENAGQSVFHLHYHLMGGWKKGEKQIFL